MMSLLLGAESCPLRLVSAAAATADGTSNADTARATVVYSSTEAALIDDTRGTFAAALRSQYALLPQFLLSEKTCQQHVVE